MRIDEHDKLAALAAEDGVSRARQDDIEFLRQTGERYRLRPEVPGEFLDGWDPQDAEYSGLVLVMICGRRGICRRQMLADKRTSRERRRRRPALASDQAWLAQYPGEQYRIRPILPSEAPNSSESKRAAGVMVVNRDPGVAPYAMRLACEREQ
jgi:hypothetical protein